MNIRRIIAFARKEATEILRDRVTLGVAIGMPLVILFLFGYAISLDVEDIAFGVYDADMSRDSRALVERFSTSEHFTFVHAARSETDLAQAMQSGQIRLALNIPRRFEARLHAGERPQVQLIVDGTYAITAAVTVAYARALTATFPEMPKAGAVSETRVWYNPSLRSANYIIPGLIAAILMAFPPMLTALAVTREKETGSIQQIFASPLTAAEFIVAKLLPYGVIAFVEFLLVLAFGLLWFGVPNHGDLGLLIGLGLIYVFCTVAIGLFVSCLTSSQLIAMLIAFIVTLMPSFLFSGFLFPIFTMPAMMQLYAQLFPATYFMEISRGIVMRGATLAELWHHVAVLILFTLVLIGISVLLLKKKVA